MNFKSEIESNGLRVKGRYVQKKSSKTNRWETCGYYNASNGADEENIVLFTDCYPYKAGLNFQSNTGTLTDINDIRPIRAEKPLESLIIPFTEKEINDVTVADSNFSKFLHNIKKWKESNGDYELNNPYKIRGIKKGYLENGTLFPYYNFDGELMTGKIIKYNKNTGKRLKTGFSTNWLHTYKPILSDLKHDKNGSNGVKCFFGEHLLKEHKKKPVIIVESEKTAIVLNCIFNDDIVVIASGGSQFLRKSIKNLRERVEKQGLNLDDRDIYVMPDCKVDEWYDIAYENNFKRFEVLDILSSLNDFNELVKEGDDVADAILNYLNGDDRYFNVQRIINQAIYKCVYGGRGRHISRELSDSFLFSKRDIKKVKRICLTIDDSKESNVKYSLGGGQGEFSDYTNFRIYEESFKCLTANKDINGGTWSKEHNQKVDYCEETLEAEFKRIFIILLMLNSQFDSDNKLTYPFVDKITVRKFYISILNNINEYSVYSFNARYIYDKLDSWTAEFTTDANGMAKNLSDVLGIDAEKLFWKKRNWMVLPDNEIEDVEGEYNSFLSRLNEDMSLHIASNIFSEKAKESLLVYQQPTDDEFAILKPILSEDCNLTRSHREVRDMIKEYNVCLTGGWTTSHIDHYNVIYSDLRDTYENRPDFGVSYITTTNIEDTKSKSFSENGEFIPFKLPTQKAISEATGIKTKSSIKKVKDSLNADWDDAEAIAEKLRFLIHNPTEYDVKRVERVYTTKKEDGSEIKGKHVDISLIPNFSKMGTPDENKPDYNEVRKQQLILEELRLKDEAKRKEMKETLDIINESYRMNESEADLTKKLRSKHPKTSWMDDCVNAYDKTTDERTFDEYFEDMPTNEVWWEWKWDDIRDGKEYTPVIERNINHELDF